MDGTKMVLDQTPTEHHEREKSLKAKNPRLGGLHRPLPVAVKMATPGSTGPLNPTWVEALMGFPHGWTELGKQD
jgi:hypothetical protein|tara:strand:- start:883 stop:1104 length:222 start_codon:yes stop_codon:yes gene_type:complete